jgi:hypothetical protein
MYIDSTYEGPQDSDQTVAAELRESLENLLAAHSVDLTLHGHHHSYQRSCPLLSGECVGYGPGEACHFLSCGLSFREKGVWVSGTGFTAYLGILGCVRGFGMVTQLRGSLWRVSGGYLGSSIVELTFHGQGEGQTRLYKL